MELLEQNIINNPAKARLRPGLQKLVTKCLDIQAQDAKEAGMLAFMARATILATLPHSKQKSHIFQRKNGDYTLTMMANPHFGLPYGSLPRLILAWMTREAKRTGSPILQLGKTFSQFLTTLNLSQSGGVRGDATRLREQMLRLFTTHISCLYQNSSRGECKSDQFLVAKSFELWWNPLKGSQGNILHNSTITLAKDFFEEIIDRPVPVDFRVLQALRRSPLQIDIYIWLTYRFSYLKRPSLIGWGLLANQFGSNYANDAQGLRDFKKQFLKSLHIVTAIYAGADVQIRDKGIYLKPSQTHIKSKIQGDLIC